MPDELSIDEEKNEDVESKFLSAEALPEIKSSIKDKTEGAPIIRTMQKDIEALQTKTPEALAAQAAEEGKKTAKEQEIARKKAEEEETIRLKAEQEEKKHQEKDDQKRIEAEKIAAEETARQAIEEQKRAEEEARIKAEEEETARKIAETEEKMRLEEAERIKAEQEAARIDTEKEETARLIAEQVEKERLKKEEQERIEAERIAAEETAKQAIEEQKRAEEEVKRIKQEEDARLKEEELRQADEAEKMRLEIEKEAETRAQKEEEQTSVLQEAKIIPPPPQTETQEKEEIVITKVGEKYLIKRKSLRLILAGLIIILFTLAGLTIWQIFYSKTPIIPSAVKQIFIPEPTPPGETVEPITPSTPPPVEKEPEVLPTSYLNKEPEKTIVIISTEKTRAAILEAMNIEAQNQESDDTLKRVIIKIGDHYLTLQELFETFEIETPAGWLANFNSDLNLFFYTQSEGFRWGAVLKWRDAEKAVSDMNTWETTGLDNAFNPFYLNIVKGENLTKEFRNGTPYKGVENIRFTNFPFEDLSIDYAFYKDFLIIDSSRKSLHKIIDFITTE